jgi:hypothetical protein
VHGLQWDTSPCYPTLSHQLADNILARNGLSRKFIQLSRGVSKPVKGLTTSSARAGAAPLRATPDFAVYPTGGGLCSPPHARVEVKGFGLSEENPLGSGVKQRLLLRPKHRNKSRPRPSAWRRSRTVCAPLVRRRIAVIKTRSAKVVHFQRRPSLCVREGVVVTPRKRSGSLSLRTRVWRVGLYRYGIGRVS